MLIPETRYNLFEHTVTPHAKIVQILVNASYWVGRSLSALKMLNEDSQIIMCFDPHRNLHWRSINIPNDEELIGFQAEPNLRALAFIFYKPNGY